MRCPDWRFLSRIGKSWGCFSWKRHYADQLWKFDENSRNGQAIGRKRRNFLRSNRPANHLPLRRWDLDKISQKDRQMHRDARGSQYLWNGLWDSFHVAGKMLPELESSRDQNHRLRHTFPFGAGASLPANRMEDLRQGQKAHELLMILCYWLSYRSSLSLGLLFFVPFLLLEELSLVSFENLLKPNSHVFVKGKLPSSCHLLTMTRQPSQKILFGLVVTLGSLLYLRQHLLAYLRQLNNNARSTAGLKLFLGNFFWVLGYLTRVSPFFLIKGSLKPILML